MFLRDARHCTERDPSKCCERQFTSCPGPSTKFVSGANVSAPTSAPTPQKKCWIAECNDGLCRSIMPRSNGQRIGLKLPAQLEKELGINTQTSKPRKAGHGVPQRRKDRRKAEREQKRFAGVRREHYTSQTRQERVLDDSENGGGSSESDASPQPLPRKLKHNSSPPEQAVPNEKPKPKSILKRTAPPRPPSPSQTSESFDLSRSPSPELVLDRSSKAFKDRAAQDEAEISSLEKKLGLKSKKLPKPFTDDGLGDLLEGLDSDTESKKRKRDG